MNARTSEERYYLTRRHRVGASRYLQLRISICFRIRYPATRHTFMYSFTDAFSDPCFTFPSIARRDTTLSFRPAAVVVYDPVDVKGGDTVPPRTERAMSLRSVVYRY